jgi:hypothetical protein
MAARPDLSGRRRWVERDGSVEPLHLPTRSFRVVEIDREADAAPLWGGGVFSVRIAECIAAIASS